MISRIPEPALMLGEDQCEFYNQEFIDYPEMLDEFMGLYEKYANITQGTVVDLGSGSCNFVIDLCLKFPNLSFVCYEASGEMIKIAKQNIQHHNLENRISIVEDDFFKATGRFNLVIANRVLHHVNDTEQFWKLLNSLSDNVLVCDLERPHSLNDIQENFSTDLKNSFLSAYSEDEVKVQIKKYKYSFERTYEENRLSKFVVFTNTNT